MYWVRLTKSKTFFYGFPYLSPSQHSTSSVSVKEKRRGYLERELRVKKKNKYGKGRNKERAQKSKDNLGLRRPKPVSIRKCSLLRVTTRQVWKYPKAPGDLLKSLR